MTKISDASRKNAIVIWQEAEGEIGEPALLIQPFNDCVSITQGKDTILVNYESIRDISKVLNKLERP